MKARPILMSAPMVRARLAGTKTQTRRAFKLPKGHRWDELQGGMASGNIECDRWPGTWHVSEFVCRYGQPGDRLWVRETWMDLQGAGVEVRTGDRSRYAYAADTPPGSYGDEKRKLYGLKWRPSIHMPRSVCRITLEVTGVRLERLQDISRADALAEGLDVLAGTGAIYGIKGLTGWSDDPRQAYASLWEVINGPGSWNLNPWVWVVEFA